MADVATLFRAERWIADWRSLGGFLSVGPMWSKAEGVLVDALLDLAPSSVPCHSPTWQRILHLRAMLELPGARAAVIDHMSRVQATQGVA